MNFQTVADYLKNKDGQIYLVAAGRLDRPDKDAEEDWRYMEILRAAVSGEEIDLDAKLLEIKMIISSDYRSENFGDDFRIVLDLNRYNILVTCQRSDGGIIVKEK